MKIPIVGTPELESPQGSFRPADVNVFDKVGEAGQRAGEAAQSVGGVAGDLGMRVKRALDFSAVEKADTSAEQGFQKFKDSLQDGKNPQNNDPTSFAKRWDDTKTGMLNAIGSDPAIKQLSANAQIEYKKRMAMFDAMSTQQVGHLATEKALQNGVGDALTTYEYRLMRGDQDGAKDVIDGAVKTGLLSPEIGKEKIFEIPMKAQYNQAVQLMMQDPESGGGPIVLEKKLREQEADGTYKYYPNVIGQSRQALAYDAWRNSRSLQAQTAEDYAMQSASGEQPDPTQLDKDLRLGKISQGQYKALAKPVKVFSPQAYAGLMGEVAKFDPHADTDHSGEAELWGKLNMASPFLSAPANQQLASTFKAKLSDKSGGLNSIAVKNVLSRNEQMFQSGGYGKFNITHQPTTEEMAKNPDAKPSKQFLPSVQASAAVKKAQVDQMIMDAVQANPELQHNEKALMELYQSATQQVRGQVGASLFRSPALNLSAPKQADDNQGP